MAQHEWGEAWACPGSWGRWGARGAWLPSADEMGGGTCTAVAPAEPREWQLGWGQAGPGAECQRWLLPEIGSCRAGEPGARRGLASRGRWHSRAHGGHGRPPALQSNSISPPAPPYLSRDLPVPRSTKERERDGVRPESEQLGGPSAPAPAQLTCTRRRLRPSWAGPPSPPGCLPCPSLQTQRGPNFSSRPASTEQWASPQAGTQARLSLWALNTDSTLFQRLSGTDKPSRVNCSPPVGLATTRPGVRRNSP